MSVYLGDYFPGCTVHGSFTTVTTTGAPTTIAGNNVCVVVYKFLGGEATGFACTTVGNTLALNCGGATGWNTYSITTTDAFFSCGRDYAVILRHGTVGGTCVSGYTLAHFSMINRSGLQAQNYGKRLTLTTGGAVNINWAGVEGCTNATGLSCTSIYSATDVTNEVNINPCVTVFGVTSKVEAHPCSTILSVTSVLNNVNINPCSTVFSVASKVETHACSTIFSVQKVLDPSNIGSGSAPTAVEIADEVQTRNVGLDWTNITGCTTRHFLACTAIYSADAVCTHIRVHPCATVFSVQSVLNNVPGVTAAVTAGTVSDKTGYSLSAAGIACVTSAPIHEPANVPGWPMSICTALGWVAALASNCITQTASHQTLCNRAVNASIASADLTCEATIVHRGTFGTVIP